MNLAITPVKFNNYSATQNCKNNSQQNFEGLQARLLKHTSETGKEITFNSLVRRRDTIIDRFLGKFEEVAKGIGLNTEKLEQKGYMVDFIPEYQNSSKMTGVLKDKAGNVVQQDDRPILFRIRSGMEFDEAENFAYDLKELKLDTNA